ncbi:YidC/Oxa1 family membrane protein insertase [Lacrimispora saccharolytica]|uniref:YidC/Oxa1 family membrane protein insertase n=1 Tax=Lacrimispora saccharolytica TaxID=84030 RepID=UPI00265C9A6C|nr:YidC/Oxa1 family membrane protein insertase [Lacrimispora saccharolytica]MCI7558045.1 YidC/Oxa1 family membrane protein insertase [Lachnospiraceae bacterium]
MEFTGIYLTQYEGAILGPVAKLLGYLMDWIFNGLYAIGIPNIGIAIILFTIVIYMLMLPLTIKQQKFSKLSAKMNPEIQAIQKKYNGKKDNDSVMAMNQETQAVYAKYGVSPTGSCVQLLIQMPILMALYRVIYAIPAYVGKVKEIFIPMSEALYSQSGIKNFIEGLSNANYFSSQFKNALYIDNDPTYVKNVIIDSFNRASTAEWHSAMDLFTGQSDLIGKAMVDFENFNNFLGLNIANSPSFTIKTALADKHFLLIIGALMVPVLAALTQWINTKLMPQPENGNTQTDQMAATMKSMNVMMPLMSAFFCYTMPIGMGIYWIAGAVVRCIQQIVINKHIDKMDIDEIIEKNSAKAEKKIKKQQENIQRMNEYATMNTRNMGIGDKARLANNASDNGKNANNSVAGDFTKTVNAKPGSLASKANMVTDYNNRK